jgi:hypothetical protein
MIVPCTQEFESLESLAQEFGMDAVVLQETVEEYNEGVRNGKDKLGKSLRQDAKPIEQPPFYACRYGN